MNNKLKSEKLMNIAWASLVGILVTACSGNRDPQFAILGKSQGFVSQQANNKVDILWVIDNSGSMGPKQTNLSNSINSFMSQFVTKNFDYQISVLTTDTRTVGAGGQGSCSVGNPLIISPTTPNPVGSLATNANVGNFGDAAAKGIDAVKTALSAPNVTGCNANFLRSGAYLAVIFFSDADDNDSVTTPAGLVSFLDTVKTPTTTPGGNTVRSYSLNAMVAPDHTTATCQALGPFTETGTKFITAANATGGIVADICEPDFSAGLLAVGTKILEQTTAVRLASVPDTGTLYVVVGSNVAPNSATDGYTYDSGTNSIIFHGSYIPNGANVPIIVNYTPADIIR